MFTILASLLIALLLAAALSIGTALFLAELAPRWLRLPLGVLIESLAAIPSVALGILGLLLAGPWLQAHLFSSALTGAGLTPSDGLSSGLTVLVATSLLALLVSPMITSTARQILQAVPRLQREGAYALGATPWQVARIALLSGTRRGLVGAVLFGMARALGEVVAAALVIGSQSAITEWLTALTAQLVSNPGQAAPALDRQALLELSVVLLVLAVPLNALARSLFHSSSSST